MTWQDELAKRIVDAGGLDELTDSMAFVLPVGPVPWGQLAGRVNDRPVAGVPAGRLMVSGFEWSFDVNVGRWEWTMTVVLHPDRSWNAMEQEPDGSWREVRDAAGNLPYPPADLSVIPSRDEPRVAGERLWAGDPVKLVAYAAEAGRTCARCRQSGSVFVETRVGELCAECFQQALTPESWRDRPALL